ncbi:hypothetical protein SCACP_36470 [Sporomusa carbonis]
MQRRNRKRSNGFARGLKATREVLDNIPVLKGPKSFLYEALQGLFPALA